MEYLELLIGGFAALNTLAVIALSYIINATNGRIRELGARYDSLHRDFNNLQIKIASMEATQKARAEHFEVLSKKLDMLTDRIDHMKDMYEKSMKELFEKYDLKIKQ